MQETRKEFKASTEWQYEKSQEFSELRERTRKEKEDFTKKNAGVKKSYKFVSNGFKLTFFK